MHTTTLRWCRQQITGMWGLFGCCAIYLLNVVSTLPCATVWHWILQPGTAIQRRWHCCAATCAVSVGPEWCRPLGRRHLIGSMLGSVKGSCRQGAESSYTCNAAVLSAVRSAVQNGHLDAVELLCGLPLSSGVELACCHKALAIAAERGYVDVVAFLFRLPACGLDYTAKLRAFHAACRSAHGHVVFRKLCFLPSPVGLESGDLDLYLVSLSKQTPRELALACEQALAWRRRYILTLATLRRCSRAASVVTHVRLL